MSKLRFRVVETAFKKQAVEVPTPDERPSGYFGQNVFNRAKMFKYLTEKHMDESRTVSTTALHSTEKQPMPLPLA